MCESEGGRANKGGTGQTKTPKTHVMEHAGVSVLVLVLVLVLVFIFVFVLVLVCKHVARRGKKRKKKGKPQNKTKQKNPHHLDRSAVFDNLLFERRQGHFFDQLVPKILRELEEIGSESRIKVGQEGVHLMGENGSIV
jgi:hypothetical protein